MRLADFAPPHESDTIGALREAVATWSATWPSARRLDAEHRLPGRLLEEAAEIGLMGLTLPESHGGAGLSMTAAAAVVADLAALDRSFATTLGLHLGLGTRGLVAGGDPCQHARWLPELAAGRVLAAFCATEPGAGSDLTALGTRLAPTDLGWTLTGEKAYVTNGGLEGLYTVLAAVPDQAGGWKGRSLALVSREAPGVVVGAEEGKLGLRASSTTSVWFEGVALDDVAVLGVPGEGHALVADVLAWGRTLMAAGCVGSAQAALQAARAHTASRRQFGKALADLPVVAHQLDAMDLRLQGMTALVGAATAAEDREHLSLCAKVFASESAWQITDRALQLHGGLGYIEESGLPLLLRDLRVTRIFEGANDVLLSRVGALARMGQGTRVGEGACFADLQRGLAACPGVRVFSDPLRLHALGRLELAATVVAATRARDPHLADALDRVLARESGVVATALETGEVFA
jgi:alkylation response protein AidB-like acyl-CoA dehydrogenase